jgi:putative MATE family efflux protein
LTFPLAAHPPSLVRPRAAAYYHPAMSDVASAGAASAGLERPLEIHELPARQSKRELFKLLVVLSAPVFAEHLLHVGVGVTDTWLANHLVWDAGLAGPALESARAANAAATKAVGTISYVIWFIGIIVSAIGVGSTAIIARAIGAKHRSLASSVCGQSITASVLLGVIVGASAIALASPFSTMAQLHAQSHGYAVSYMRLLGFAMPFTMLMFTANACLRGAGDTLTPAISMIVVDVVNMFFSYSLTYGAFGLPRLGFDGIAAGTVIAYIAGGMIQFTVLIRGRGGLRLFWHRLRPHWLTLKRVLRIGIPSGVQGVLQWFANFGVVIVVNKMPDAAAAAHTNAIRVESISYMSGFAVATAVATMVGQSLGMKDRARARHSILIGYGFGGGLMSFFGILFILFGRQCAALLSNDPTVIDLTARCLFITGFIQAAFAAAMIFSSALQGAGDTLAVMLYNLSSIFGLRLLGVIVVGRLLGYGIAAVWIVLSAELCVRGLLMYSRFASGKWQTVKV